MDGEHQVTMGLRRQIAKARHILQVMLRSLNNTDQMLRALQRYLDRIFSHGVTDNNWHCSSAHHGSPKYAGMPFCLQHNCACRSVDSLHAQWAQGQ